ncbi:hypothetical protein PSC71_05735 [Devosia sp. J2-20]|uniref:hypothetical protein n=1 Tax=Devosia sp. J2-20 TaxID=3026161 RepID=UPI00249AA297|nr:hypothetical protein [Devosia sp. J2-20]WDR00277.1 hypothetical protein PSC71_05735 [Devosia sp. J2-20]
MSPWRLIVALCLCSVPGMARGDEQIMLTRALEGAITQFEAARPRLGQSLSGVDIGAYGDALYRHRFAGGAWPGQTELTFDIRPDNSGSCNRFAAFVRIPPQVAGRDECQAMAFAARIEQLARGDYTPVDSYWQAQDCSGGPYRLP